MKASRKEPAPGKFRGQMQGAQRRETGNVLAQSEMNLSVPDVPALAELLNCHPEEVSTHPHEFRGCPFTTKGKKNTECENISHVQRAA